jgi:hypothetical protein
LNDLLNLILKKINLIIARNKPKYFNINSPSAVVILLKIFIKEKKRLSVK